MLRLLVVALTLTAAAAHAGTYRVPSVYATIQAGVDAASEGDTVLVAPGTYTGPGNYAISIGGKALVVLSEAGPAVTIIDCEGNNRAFRIYGPMQNIPVIEGFTITNGWVGGLYAPGGAVYADHCSLRLVHCVLAANQGVSGAAVFVDGPSCQLVNCTFVGNNGNAICYALFSEEVILDKCLFYANSTVDGQIVYLSRCTGSVTMTCCNLYANMPLDWSDRILSQFGVNGNFSTPPLLCDVAGGNYGLHALSPLRPEASPCGELIGALDVSCTDCYDVDGDGLCAVDDNCPVHANADQLDSDEDGIGDACEDADGDQVLDVFDNCVEVPNVDQSDQDGDDIGNPCDDDRDGDGYVNESDNCPANYNPDQEDGNGDGIGEACCCIGLKGNANGSSGDEPTISDVSVIIDALFINGNWSVIACRAEADVNSSGGCNPTQEDITISDASLLIFYLFVCGCDNDCRPRCPNCP